MLPYLENQWISPTAPQRGGRCLVEKIQRGLERLRTLLQLPEGGHLLFFSSVQEAIEKIIWGTYVVKSRPFGKNHFLTSCIEESSLLSPLSLLEELGCSCTMLPICKQGIVEASSLQKAHTDQSALLSLSAANGLTGVIHPIQEFAALCRESTLWLHLDISYCVGKIQFNWEEIDPDFLTLRGEVLHAPAGTALLYVREGIFLPTLSIEREEMNIGGASFHAAGFFALLQAIEESVDHFLTLTTTLSRRRLQFEREILQEIEGAQLLLPHAERLPNTTLLAFPPLFSEFLLHALDRRAISASIGGDPFQPLSTLLQASGEDPLLALSALHFSLSRETESTDLECLIRELKQLVPRLRKTTGTLLSSSSP